MSREVRAEAELRASPGEIWEIVMDPRRLGEWVTTHEGLEGDVPDRLEQGSTFKQRLKVGGPTFTATWNVVECDPPHHVRWEGRVPAAPGLTSSTGSNLLRRGPASPTRIALSCPVELWDEWLAGRSASEWRNGRLTALSRTLRA